MFSFAWWNLFKLESTYLYLVRRASGILTEKVINLTDDILYRERESLIQVKSTHILIIKMLSLSYKFIWHENIENYDKKITGNFVYQVFIIAEINGYIFWKSLWLYRVVQF